MGNIIDKLNKASNKLYIANQTINTKMDSLLNPVEYKSNTYNSTGQNVFDSVQTGLNTIDKIVDLPSNTVNRITSAFNSLTNTITGGASSVSSKATSLANKVGLSSSSSSSSATGSSSSSATTSNSAMGIASSIFSPSGYSTGTYSTGVSSGIMPLNSSVYSNSGNSTSGLTNAISNVKNLFTPSNNGYYTPTSGSYNSTNNGFYTPNSSSYAGSNYGFGESLKENKAFKEYDTFEPAPSWLFLVTINPPAGLTNVSGTQVSLLVESINVPIPSISSTKRRFQGRDCNFPGRVSVESFSMTIVEDKTYKVTKFFKDWQDLICDANGNYALPVNYKGSFIVQGSNIKGELSSNSLLMTLNDVYPEKISGLNYSSGNDFIKLSITMACDWVTLDQK